MRKCSISYLTCLSLSSYLIPSLSPISKYQCMPSYGFLRAPWNLQVSPYITRYHKDCGMSFGGAHSYVANPWPSCEAHHFAAFQIDAIAEYIPYMATGAHGGVHTMIGGAGGKDCEAWDKLSKLAGESNVEYFKSTTTLFPRNAWRYGFCDSPSSEDCVGTGVDATDGTSDKCKLTCLGCDEDQFTQEQLDGYLAYMFPLYSPDTDAEAQKVIRTMMCDSKVLGKYVSLFHVLSLTHVASLSLTYRL